MRVAEEQRQEIEREELHGEADEEKHLLGAAFRSVTQAPKAKRRAGFGGGSDDDEYGDFDDEDEVWREVDGDFEEVSVEDQVTPPPMRSVRCECLAGRAMIDCMSRSSESESTYHRHQKP